MKPWLLIGMLCLPNLVWAGERVVIFRKSDGLYVGRVDPPHSIEVELRNIAMSSLGGTPEDYRVVALTTPIPPGHRPILQPDGTVWSEAYPDSSPGEPIDIPVESLGGVLGGALAGAGVAFLRGRKRKNPTP